MRRKIPLLLILALCLSLPKLISAQATQAPSKQEQTQASRLDLTSYTASEIVEAASRAGITLYTEDEAVAALKVGCKTAAQTAVDAAVPAAVKIALEDANKTAKAESDRLKSELWPWKIGAIAGVAGTLGGLIWAASK